MTGRKVDLRLPRSPSGLASYPRVVMTRRPDLLEVTEPCEFEIVVERVRIDPARVAAYAAVCGFERGPRRGAVPLTYPHVLAMPLHLRIMAHRDFPLRPMGLIHLSNAISAPGELRDGATCELAVRAHAYRRTEAGLVFDMDTEIREGGAVAWRETCVFMSRWPDSAQRTGGRPPRPPKAPRDASVLAEFAVDRATAWRYARVSNDFNPIHLSDRAARFFGLRGAISHGMWSLARSLAADGADAAPAPGSRLETQFLTPVQLPARVTVKRWVEEGRPKRAMCDVRTGRVHMVAWWDDEAIRG